MPTELKPCPFCGCDKIPVADNRERYGTDERYNCGCVRCNAIGPCAGSEAAAIAAWNQRAETKEADRATETEV